MGKEKLGKVTVSGLVGWGGVGGSLGWQGRGGGAVEPHQYCSGAEHMQVCEG